MAESRVTPLSVQGWHAVDEEHAGRLRWQPVLQLDGWSPGLDVWFDSKEGCLAFVRGEVLGRELREVSRTCRTHRQAETPWRS